MASATESQTFSWDFTLQDVHLKTYLPSLPPLAPFPSQNTSKTSLSVSRLVLPVQHPSLPAGFCLAGDSITS